MEVLSAAAVRTTIFRCRPPALPCAKQTYAPGLPREIPRALFRRVGWARLPVGLRRAARPPVAARHFHRQQLPPTFATPPRATPPGLSPETFCYSAADARAMDCSWSMDCRTPPHVQTARACFPSWSRDRRDEHTSEL